MINDLRKKEAKAQVSAKNAMALAETATKEVVQRPADALRSPLPPFSLDLGLYSINVTTSRSSHPGRVLLSFA